MRDDICTIPISEVFEDGDGCPVCRMRKMLEDRFIVPEKKFTPFKFFKKEVTDNEEQN